ncbi:MAG: prolipoprotein diacylglyceryl transferase [Flavobacteriales bacterium]
MVRELLGIDVSFLYIIKTFGFFVAMAFLLAGYYFAAELKRKEQLGLLKPQKKKILVGKPASASELLFNGLMGFLLGYKIFYIFFHYEEFALNAQEVLLSTKGSFVGALLFATVGVYFKYREKQKLKKDTPEWVETLIHPHQNIGNLTLIAAISGLVGAKIFHLLENPDQAKYLFKSAEGFFSGLTMYGGLIFGAVAVLWYAKKQGLTIFHTMDASAPALMLAYGVGRIGCMLAGDGDWGIDNLNPKPAAMSFLPDWMWSFRFPHNVINAGIPIDGCEGQYCSILENPVFPTPFYESVACILIFLALWSVRKRISIPGYMFSIYLIANGVERFFIELIRVNERINFFGIDCTQAELIAILLILTGLSGIIFLPKFREKLNAV